MGRIRSNGVERFVHCCHVLPYSVSSRCFVYIAGAAEAGDGLIGSGVSERYPPVPPELSNREIAIRDYAAKS